MSHFLDMIWPAQQRCLFCGDSFVARTWGLCADCLKKLPIEPGTFSLIIPDAEDGAAAFAYTGAARMCLLKMKFSGQTWRAKSMAQWMAYTLRQRTCSFPEVVVPVPIHPLRLLGRGYGQCTLLGKAIAQELDLPYEGGALIRRDHGRPMYAMTRKEHAEKIAGRYRSGKSATAIIGKRVLLIDDVCTTGSTLTECTRVLKQAGAAQVVAICFATAVAEHPIA